MKNINSKLILLLLNILLLVGCSSGGGRGRNIGVEVKDRVSSVGVEPSSIVLMLPLKGKFAATSKAIRNGFLAAYYHVRKEHPNINIKVVDTSNNNIGVLYREAVAGGADLVVGPLIKKEVEDLVFIDSLPIPVIALNTLDDYTRNFKENLYQFGLLPQDEATQVASKMMEQQYDQVAIIYPDNSWGEKVAEAFRSRYELSGGEVMAVLNYSTSSKLSEQVCYFLAQDANELCVRKNSKDKKKEKEERKKRKEEREKREKDRVVDADENGENEEGMEGDEDQPDSSETMRRQDINAIFLVSNAKNARQLVPLLKFYYAGDLPVYSISSIYTGTRAPNLDRDLNGINFYDMPWVLQKPKFLNQDLQKVREKIMSLWGDSFSNYSKLYALGIDAYGLAIGLNRLIESPQDGLDGATGRLYLDSFNHIYRELERAQIRGGVPVILRSN